MGWFLRREKMFLSKLHERALHQLAEAREPALHIGAEMHPQHPPAPLREHFEIALCLETLQHAKAVLLPGNGHVLRIVARHLKEDAVVRSAFVQLPRRM